jgi:fatty acid synthase subunit alpha
MCAVNPGRLSPTFSDAALREVVDSIATRTASLVVNYNVEVSLTFLTAIYLDFLYNLQGQQYVCAGELGRL